VPAPEGSSAANYARHFVGSIFFRTFEPLGIKPEFYWVSELYAAGAWTRTSSWRSTEPTGCATIYMRSATSSGPALAADPGHLRELRQDRHDLRHRLGRRHGRIRLQAGHGLVGAGCGHEGRVSPLGGRAKLPWNLEWAAKWGLLGVTIEGCGKDLATAGGSRDRSDAISREVFEVEPPRNVTYEFLNIGGKKMSTSKGRASPRTRSPKSCRPSSCASSSCAPAEPGHRLRSGRATRSRASSTNSTGSPRPRPGAKSRASCPPTTSGSSSTRCWGRRPDVAAAAPRSGPRSGTWRCCSRSRA
jgi:hypothetical protein